MTSVRRTDLMRLIRKRAREHGLPLTTREGARHTVVTVGTARSVVPRHTEIRDLLVTRILDQLDLRGDR